MSIKPASRRAASALTSASAAGLACLALTATSAAAQEAKLEGTWKIAAPQSTFKPEGGSVPFTAEGRKFFESNKKNRAKGAFKEYDYAMARCASPGVPRLALTPDRFHIWERPGYTQISFEWNRLIRQIETPGLTTQHEAPISLADSDATFGSARGKSVGRWDGEVFLVETTGLSENTLIDAVVPHGPDTKITERWRRKDAETLENRITITDAEYFTRPWEAVVTYKRQPDALFPEDVCLDRLAAGKPPLPR